MLSQTTTKLHCSLSEDKTSDDKSRPLEQESSAARYIRFYWKAAYFVLTVKLSILCLIKIPQIMVLKPDFYVIKRYHITETRENCA